MATDTTAAAAPVSIQPLRDVRGFWRVLLAIIAPLPVLAKGLYYLLIPVNGDADFKTTLAAFTAHPQLAGALKYLDAVFVVGLIPAAFAVAWAARRGAPRLASAGAVVSLLGFFAGLTLLGGIETPPLVAAQNHVDPAAMSNLQDALENEPLLGVASLLFIVGIVIGLGLLGAALWRSRSAPAWMGIALMVGGITHPFIPGHVGQGAGLIVAAVGCAGASVALLRTRNEGFDLPPARANGAV